MREDDPVHDPRLVAGHARRGDIQRGGKAVVSAFAEQGRSGFSTLMDRDNDQSATAAVGLTYARTESFDVDMFATLRYWPEPGSLFGAGLRWRL